MNEKYQKLMMDCQNFLIYYGSRAKESYDDDAFWQEVLTNANIVVKRNGNPRLGEQLMNAILDEIERNGKGHPFETKEQISSWTEKTA